MDLIKWFNDNQGFVISTLTLVYVIATMIIMRYNQRTIKEMQITREEESRPYVFIYLDKDPRDEWFYLRIRNYGKMGARIEEVNICPTLKLQNNGDISEILKEVILAPNQTIELIIESHKKETSKNDYKVDFKYSNLTNKKVYYEKYTLIIQYSRFMGYTEASASNLTPTENSLRNIADHLDTIRRKI